MKHATTASPQLTVHICVAVQVCVFNNGQNRSDCTCLSSGINMMLYSEITVVLE
jgi:hypothetical protein